MEVRVVWGATSLIHSWVRSARKMVTQGPPKVVVPAVLGESQAPIALSSRSVCLRTGSIRRARVQLAATGLTVAPGLMAATTVAEAAVAVAEDRALPMASTPLSSLRL